MEFAPLSHPYHCLLITCNVCTSLQTSCFSGTRGRPVTARTWWRTCRGWTHKHFHVGWETRTWMEEGHHTAPESPRGLVPTHSPRRPLPGWAENTQGPLTPFIPTTFRFLQPQNHHCRNSKVGVVTDASPRAGNLAIATKIIRVQTL